MITGDLPETARAIAGQAGIGDGQVITGTQIAALDSETLTRRLDGVAVCLRIASGKN